MIKAMILASLFTLAAMSQTVFAQDSNTQAPGTAAPLTAADLSQYTYSYGTVVKATLESVVLQEYDYDSDVEKEVTYLVDPQIKLEGVKAVTDLAAEDVIEVYYKEQDGKKVAKIIRREVIEEENVSPDNS